MVLDHIYMPGGAAGVFTKSVKVVPMVRLCFFYSFISSLN